jgi:hypothetical protein
MTDDFKVLGRTSGQKVGVYEDIRTNCFLFRKFDFGVQEIALGKWGSGEEGKWEG